MSPGAAAPGQRAYQGRIQGENRVGSIDEQQAQLAAGPQAFKPDRLRGGEERGLPEENLTGSVDGKNRFALAAAESPGLGGLELLRADGAAEHLGEDIIGLHVALGVEERDSFVQVVFDVEELTEPEKLENLVNLGLNLQQHQIAASGLHRFEEMGEGTDARTGNVGKTAAVKNQLAVSGFNGPGDFFLKEIGVVCVDVSGKVKYHTALHRIDFLQPDFETVVFLDIESVDYFVVIGHYAP